jgi:hypothetical protein
VERETDKRHHGLEKGGVEMGVGDRLKQSRELKGLSQGKIEERSGLFRCYISWVSAVLDWCKRTAGKYRRFAGSIADQLRMVGRENQFEVARVMNVRHPLHVDFAGQRVEFREFAKVLSIGDRIRVLCDDGVLVAEKISQTQFKVIHAETMTDSVH